jgi:hypothetical protein
MAEHETSSIPELLRSVLDDTRELIREELALVRAEIREEAVACQRIGVAFAAAAVLAPIALIMLCIAVGGATADLFNAPPWLGYGVVALLLGAAAFFFMNRGRTGLGNLRGLPRTTESLRENMAWIQSKSSSR